MPDEEDAVKSILGVAEAALSGMLVHIRPLMMKRIREVLERNETIVHQTPVALDHLTKEIADALFPSSIAET